MRWGESLTLEFVKLYLKEECLWNPDHPDYKLKHKRQTCYCTIANEFEAYSGRKMSLPEIKTKIKNLRSTYAQQVNKIMQKSGPDAMYEPTLIWFKEMDRCLKNVPMSLRQSIVSKHQDNQVVDSSMWEENEGTIEKVEDENPDPLSSQTDDEEYLVETLDDSIVVKTEPCNPFKNNKKKKFKYRSQARQSQNAFYIPNTNGDEDEFEIYGKFIASQLRQMDLQKALRLQLEIQSLVSEARISELP